MKLKITILFITLLGLIWACSRENFDENGSTGFPRAEPALNAVDRTTINKIDVSCEGTCDNSTTSCGMIVDMKTNTVECDCSGCKMVLSSTYAGGDSDFKNMISLFSGPFNAFIRKNYQAEKAIINSLQIERYDNNAVSILFDYRVPGGNSSSTVMYVAEYNPDGSLARKIEVDCKATKCDCRERYQAGTVECTCQEDCTMTITVIE